jgi:hypothetical protein
VIDLFLVSMWPGLFVWVALYTSDFLLTMEGARMYRAGVNSTIVFEGSYELTPYYQDDVDSLRPFSPRFLAALAIGVVLVGAIWQLSIGVLAYPPAFLIGFGGLVLLELTIHIRHLRNLFLFRAVLRGTNVTGRIEYARPLTLRLSAIELFSFSGLFVVLALMTQSWFVLGGAITCASTGWNHLVQARPRSSDPSAV